MSSSNGVSKEGQKAVVTNMYLTEKDLKNLSKYKYSGVDKSIVSRYILTPYWNWLVTLMPMTVAPNTITLSGLCMVFINFATLLYFDVGYNLDKELPRWVYFSWGAGLFIYQSMDAIDGKQSRRTGMAGPLGEMFDHGCDAMNTTLEVIICAHALNLGRSWWTVASQTATLANFYLTTWEEFHTGTLYLSQFSGPVEGILIIVSIFFITGLYGPEFWDQKPLHALPRVLFSKTPLLEKYIYDQGINDLFMIFGAFGLASNVFNSYGNVILARRRAKMAILPPLLGLIPHVLHTLCLLSWINAEPYTNIIYSSRFVPFCCYWGFSFAYQVGQLILAHVTGQGMPWWNGLMVWSAIGAIDANSQALFGTAPIFHATEQSTTLFIGVSVALSFLVYMHFVYCVIYAITNYTGIACFTVRKKDEGGEWVEASKIKKQ